MVEMIGKLEKVYLASVFRELARKGAVSRLTREWAVNRE
jgi:hypothetical protein